MLDDEPYFRCIQITFHLLRFSRRWNADDDVNENDDTISSRKSATKAKKKRIRKQRFNQKRLSGKSLYGVLNNTI